LAPSVTRRVIEEFVRRPPSSVRALPAKLENLTARELEVLKLLARGLSNAEIAKELFVSETTVKTHVAHVLMKLDLRHRVEAVVIETVVQPDGFVPAGHVHPSQGERFAVKSGRLGVKVGRKKHTLGPGDVLTVEPGTAHPFWNAGDEPVTFVCEIRPALQF